MPVEVDMIVKQKPVVLDLFCGCSGMGLGARSAGFDVGLSVDIDPVLTSSYKLNFPSGNLTLADLSVTSGSVLKGLVASEIDGIIGGPPCQGFSSIGRADPDDPRRELLWHFFRLVREIRPKFFLMENVKGLVFQKNKVVLDEALETLGGAYELVGPLVLDASKLGAPTKRPRVFVLGYLPEEVEAITTADILGLHRPTVTVHDAIADLREAEFSGTVDGFDNWLLQAQQTGISQYASKLRKPDRQATGLFVTPHKEDVKRRFEQVVPGTVDAVGRHPRLKWDDHCPTIRAGTGPDKGSYQAVRPLHPDQPRVITVREAARLQGFPDWFRFHPTVWHSFRMIGNSVSPIVAYTLLSLVLDKIGASQPEGLKWTG